MYDIEEFLRSTPVQAVIWVTILLALSAVGAYVIQRLRQSGSQSTPSANELLTNFRTMHDGGKLSPTEFRQVKTVLGQSLQEEVKSDDTEGDD